MNSTKLCNACGCISDVMSNTYTQREHIYDQVYKVTKQCDTFKNNNTCFSFEYKLKNDKFGRPMYQNDKYFRKDQFTYHCEHLFYALNYDNDPEEGYHLACNLKFSVDSGDLEDEYRSIGGIYKEKVQGKLLATYNLFMWKCPVYSISYELYRRKI